MFEEICIEERDSQCASKMLQAMLRQQEVRHYLSYNKILWTLRRPRGGVSLSGCSSQQRDAFVRWLARLTSMTSFSLYSLKLRLSSIQLRPLTYLSEDLDEPSHLLCGRRILINLPDGLAEGGDTDEEFMMSQPVLSKRLKYLDTKLNQFWNRWKTEYLMELRESHRHHGGNSNAAPLTV